MTKRTILSSLKEFALELGFLPGISRDGKSRDIAFFPGIRIPGKSLGIPGKIHTIKAQVLSKKAGGIIRFSEGK